MSIPRVRFRDIAAKAGADIIIANHTTFDGTIAKTAALAKRRPGDPHPYVIGKETVSRYLTVAEGVREWSCGIVRSRPGRLRPWPLDP